MQRISVCGLFCGIKQFPSVYDKFHQFDEKKSLPSILCLFLRKQLFARRVVQGDMLQMIQNASIAMKCLMRLLLKLKTFFAG